MCGILGCSLKHRVPDAQVPRLNRELDSLQHRGPDGRGVYLDADKGIFLGHRRLAIIDTSGASAQPMQRQNHVLCYNGEIYNHQELASELETQGFNQTTSGDTEILLQAWLAWGRGSLDRFDGMFAFALFDGDRLHLITDPFGEKPLYTLTRKEGIYFASEPAPLHRLGDTRFDPSQEEQAAFLSLGFLPAPNTGYPGLEKLGPATHIEIHKGQVVSKRTYWKPDPGFVGTGAIQPLGSDALDELEHILMRSLQRRMIADVPLGLFLSSGVDSVLVAALIAKRLQKEVRAYTVAFKDGVDESKDVERITRHLGIEHTIIPSNSELRSQALSQELIDMYGEPNDNNTAFSVRQMSQVSRPFMTVALSGTGGDEMFFGYQKYAFLHDKQKLYNWLGPLVDQLRPLLSRSFDRIGAWQQARKYIFQDPAWQFLAVKNGGMSAWLRALPGASDFAATLLAPQALPIAFRARHFDLTNTMPQSYIAAIERGSMRESLEVRTPFLSRELYEKIAKFDQRALMSFGRKKTAYDLLSRLLPQDLINRGKQGFVMPIKRHMTSMSDTTPQPSNISRQQVEAIWKKRDSSSCQRLALRLDVLAKSQSRAHITA